MKFWVGSILLSLVYFSFGISFSDAIWLSILTIIHGAIIYEVIREHRKGRKEKKILKESKKSYEVTIESKTEVKPQTVIPINKKPKTQKAIIKIHKNNEACVPTEKQSLQICKQEKPFLAITPISPIAKILGDEGERIVSEELNKLVNYGNYIVLNNINIVSSMYSSQIDHVVISNYGVFVIETKNYSGKVKGHVYEEYWEVTYGNNNVKYLYNPLLQNGPHCTTILMHASGEDEYGNFNLPEFTIFPIVVFTDRSTLHIFEESESTTPVTYVDGLLHRILSHDRRFLDDEQIQIIKSRLLKASKNIADRTINSEIRYISDSNSLP